MPELRLLPLDEVLSASQIKTLSSKLSELGVDDVPIGEDAVDMEDSIHEDVLADFVDRLDAHDVACDLYLPTEFEGRVEVADYTVGSITALLDVLEQLRDELDIDEEASDPGGSLSEDEPMDLAMIEEQLSATWHSFARMATASNERQVPFHIIS